MRAALSIGQSVVQNRRERCSRRGIIEGRFCRLCELTEESSSDFEVITKSSLLLRFSKSRSIRKPVKAQSIVRNPILRRKAESFGEDKKAAPHRYRKHSVTMRGFFDGSLDIFFYPSTAAAARRTTAAALRWISSRMFWNRS